MSHRATLSCLGSLLLALLLLAPQTVEAQRFKWWQDEAVQRKVGLTGDQTKKIEDIFTTSMPDLVKAKQELDRLEQDLIPFADSSNDDVALSQWVDRVETARAELNKRRSVMLFRIRRVLTVDQRVKLESLQQERGRLYDRLNHPH